jgi:glycosyltransferase involved in cell wall biosynthesis
MNPDFSIVIPIFNEQETIPELCSRLTTVMDTLCAEGSSYEIIMVDDGSTDQSWQMIRDLHERNPRVIGVNFSRNFGHHIAITAGLDYAKGNSVVVMDGDLQDPPEEIPKLYRKLGEGYDLVYGIRAQRQDNYFRKLSTYFFTGMIRRLSGLEIAQNDAMLRIMSRKFVDSIKRFPERNRFLGGLFTWAGFNQTGIPIEHAPRFAGRSKYSIWKMAKLTMDAVTSFSYLPLKIIGLMGLLISGLSFVSGLFLIFKKLFLGVDVIGWTSTMVTILFIGGIQLVVLGVIGQYLARVFSEVQGRPLYIIKELALD